MVLAVSPSTYTLVAETMSVTARVVLIAITFLSALAFGLLFRRLLVRRLKRTVLDKWIIQTLGILIALPTLIIAAFASPIIWTPYLFYLYLYTFFFPYVVKNIDNLIPLARNIIFTLLVIALGIGVARTARTLTIRQFGGGRIDVNLRTLMARVFYYILLAITISWALSIWNISIGIPVTAIGILTVAFTFAVQDILKDLVAGFYILIERPFRIGDQISTTNGVSVYVGKVEDIQIRATKLRLVSGEEVTIPNSLVFGSSVINNTYYSERRATILIALPEEQFIKGETVSQVLQVIKGIEHIQVKPEATVLLSGYSDQKAQITARFWIGIGEHGIVSDVVYALREAFPHADLTVKESAGDV